MSLFSSTELALLRQNRPSPQEDHSTLSRWLNPWWEWAARRVPASVAPNTLTVAGSLAMVLPTLLQLWLSPTLTATQPWWACLAALLGILVFQTLDALDGKQARRTRSSSPLGSWLDHALDILTIQFVFVGAAASMGLGVNGVFCFMLATVLLGSHLLHWEVHHTRLLYLGNGTSIAEAQCLCMAIHLVTAVLGTGFWQQSTAVGALSYGDVLALVAVVGVGWSGMTGSVLRARRAGAGWRMLLQLRGQLLLVALLALAYAGIAGAAERLLYLLGCGLLGARLISDLVLHNLLDRRPVIVQWPVPVLALGVGMGAVCAWLELAEAYRLALAAITFCFCVVVTLARLGRIAQALARALGIRIFTLSTPTSAV